MAYDSRVGGLTLSRSDSPRHVSPSSLPTSRKVSGAAPFFRYLEVPSSILGRFAMEKNMYPDLAFFGLCIAPMPPCQQLPWPWAHACSEGGTSTLGAVRGGHFTC